MDAEAKKILEKLADIGKFILLLASLILFGKASFELFSNGNIEEFIDFMKWAGLASLSSVGLAGVGGYTREDVIIGVVAVIILFFSWDAFKYQTTGDDSTWGLKSQVERLREDLDAKDAVLLWMGKKFGVDVAKEVEKTKATRRALRGEEGRTVVGDEESTNDD